MKVNELLNEASTPGRGWNGKIKKIDSILSWMYDQNILTATEKKKKDSVFRQYYRYYNDGDFPTALKVKGISKRSGEKVVETELEKYLETFIKEMLAKYLPKVNRREFRLDTLIKELSVVRDVADREDVHGLLTYWLKKTKINDEEGILAEFTEELKKSYEILKKELDSIDPASSTVVSYRKVRMKENGTWDSKLDKLYDNMVADIKLIKMYIVKLINATQKLKDELNIS